VTPDRSEISFSLPGTSGREARREKHTKAEFTKFEQNMTVSNLSKETLGPWVKFRISKADFQLRVHCDAQT
jgi:hypothetical protein